MKRLLLSILILTILIQTINIQNGNVFILDLSIEYSPGFTIHKDEWNYFAFEKIDENENSKYDYYIQFKTNVYTDIEAQIGEFDHLPSNYEIMTTHSSKQFTKTNKNSTDYYTIFTFKTSKRWIAYSIKTNKDLNYLSVYPYYNEILYGSKLVYGCLAFYLILFYIL